MALPTDQLRTGLLTAYRDFETLLRSLTPDGWAAPSRCEGWSAGDVGAHVVGQLTDITNGRLEGLGTPEVTAREVAERRGVSAVEVADELAAGIQAVAVLVAAFDDAAWAGPAPGAPDITLAEGIETLWYDTYVHADDIRVAVGAPSQRGEGLAASVSHIAEALTRQGWGPATLAFDGLPAFTVGAGSGRRLTGDPLAFVLAATGRGDPGALGLDEQVNIYR